jgi:RNA polymerase sigma factor (TIGR02999 family)
MGAAGNDLTMLLGELCDGNREVVDAILPLVYNELHAMAHRKLVNERAGHTLNTTALVHEAYIKLIDQTRITWENRIHFYGIAAQAMRRILVDHARKRLAQKRGGGKFAVTLHEESTHKETRSKELIDLDVALDELAKLNKRAAKIVECQFFAGLTQKEIAEVMSISESTVQREWRMARAWLQRAMKE